MGICKELRIKFFCAFAFYSYKESSILELDELRSRTVSSSMLLYAPRYFVPWNTLLYECIESFISNWMSYFFLLNPFRNTSFSVSSILISNTRTIWEKSLKEVWPHCPVCFSVVIVTLATACCLLLITLYACVVFSVQVSSLPEWQQDNFMLEAIPGMAVDQRQKQPDFRYGVTGLSFVFLDSGTQIYLEFTTEEWQGEEENSSEYLCSEIPDGNISRMIKIF